MGQFLGGEREESKPTKYKKETQLSTSPPGHAEKGWVPIQLPSPITGHSIMCSHGGAHSTTSCERAMIIEAKPFPPQPGLITMINEAIGLQLVNRKRTIQIKPAALTAFLQKNNLRSTSAT